MGDRINGRPIVTYTASTEPRLGECPPPESWEPGPQCDRCRKPTPPRGRDVAPAQAGDFCWCLPAPEPACPGHRYSDLNPEECLLCDAPNPEFAEPAWTDEDVATWNELTEGQHRGAALTFVAIAQRPDDVHAVAYADAPLLKRLALVRGRRNLVRLTDKGKRVAAYGASLREGSTNG